MRRSHFSAFAPICPRCHARGEDAPLTLALVFDEQDGHVLQGIITCPVCRQEFPIIDGLPLLLADLRGYVGPAMPVLLARRDLAPPLMSVLTDAAGPGGVVDSVRQTLSSYAWDHYGEFDPEEAAGSGNSPGAVARCLNAGLELLPFPPAGPAIDLGCGPGRSTFALAARVEGPVLGIDLSFPLIALGAQVLRHGRLGYARRRIGLVYDQRDFAVPMEAAARVDFWVCDVQALPFRPGQFGMVGALNLIDCLQAPADGLAAIAGLLRPGGQAVLATPYDWSGSVTPVERWLGGHSQRGSHGGAGESVLRHLLGDGGLALAAEDGDVLWQVRLHDRAIMRYSAHLVAATKGAAP